MTVTMHEGPTKDSIYIGSTDPRFRETWGSVVKVPATAVYTDLSNMASWANNKLGEEFLVEID